MPFESVPIATPLTTLVYQPTGNQALGTIRPGSALRLNHMMQQTLNRSASQIGDTS
jgi:hypothetical protein